MLRFRLTVITSVAMCLLLVACVPLGTAGQPAELTKLKVVSVPFLALAPFYIAQEEGFYAEQGLQVEFVKMQRSADAIPALINGEVDVIAGSMNVGLFNVINRQAKLKFVSTISQASANSCPNNALVARRDLMESGQLDSVAQLRGKRISMSRGNYEEYFVDTLLASHGMTIEDVEIVDLPEVSEMEALQDGSVDVVSTTEPWVTRMVNTNKALLWKGLRDVLPDIQLAFVIFGPNLLEKNPDAGKRFATAYLKAARQYAEGATERNLEIVAKHTELDRALLSQACWAAISQTGRINAEGVIGFQNWAVKKGLLDTAIGESQFWDTRFVDSANETLGPPKQ